jgi:1,4-alpha-glucan branching enzyme
VKEHTVLERTRSKSALEVTFVLPAEEPRGQVSVVGDFNGWQPGAHPLEERLDGMRAVTVKMPTGRRMRFRYLAEGDHWFNDEAADGYDGDNSLLHS